MVSASLVLKGDILVNLLISASLNRPGPKHMYV